ncbi:MAG: DUF1415 domain-containing protein [Burkholderiaceae bacterium]|nr:DUF1415 domain-containing protein [Burkholderiaceae bacterium]
MVRWLERAVIDLQLCPFAKGVHVKGQIHYAVSPARSAPGLLQDLAQEMSDLVAADPAQRDTTLLIAPGCLAEFLDFNDFLAEADALLVAQGLDGTLQIASFHPQFQFGDAGPDDVGNCTNRAPYPTLHLLREDSIDQAVEAFPEAESIYEKNIQTLETLGLAGWQALGLQARCPAQALSLASEPAAPARGDRASPAGAGSLDQEGT